MSFLCQFAIVALTTLQYLTHKKTIGETFDYEENLQLTLLGNMGK